MNFSGALHEKPKLSWFPNAVIIFTIAAAMGFKFWTTAWQKRVIENDVISYYAYLPATFIHHDISLDFMNDTSQNYSDRFWPVKLDNGNYVIKTTMGMSILYSPFFFAAHGFELASGGKADGYSSAYRSAISFAAIVFLLLGLIMTRKLLRQYFSPLITGLCLLLIVFATNLFYYSTLEPGMSHVYNFALIALFLYVNDRWLKKPDLGNTVLIGLIYGIITLVRPPNGLIILFPFLWNILSWSDFKTRIQLFIRIWPKLLIIALCGLVVWAPQLLYWKMQSGSFFINSYDEKFYFGNFHFAEALFGFRKGWYIYSPIMLLATTGIFFMRKELRSLQLSVLAFLLVFMYIAFSWWCWWYGGGYGIRAMIDIFALMAIPLAAIISYFFRQGKALKWICIAACLVFIAHGYFQTLQYRYGAIHWDSMTKKSYLFSFGHLHPQPAYWLLLQQPDYENAIKGLPERIPEKPTAINTDEDDFVYTEKNIQPADGAEFHNLFEINIPDTAFPFSGEVLFKASASNRFPNDLMICASLMSGENVLVNASMNVEPITSGGKETFVWTFELIPPDLNAKDLSIKVFFWARKKRSFYVQNIEVVFHDLKPYCGKE
ncbi:MAG: hypothetical protein A2W93_15755 [Bacteroidetes bacterium GWF2_43_63]|nr:MAG: hypothetical protein A2W94_13635 [Bacteroidetes bacterium GWE2_42_42]OFY53123.1 MAG: hypothetical protein A2W93_15755 [Bacteroidetes bacterium GWF2_43_63]HBG70363.1 hypothetical protein [Bacteroidales bacterium]HCB60590.1 hypothetical protein [Bacteroidales bacterium]HCY22959.1 hypothetical protein [Bacteroidales bacterium]